jgi:hypothetical protein
MKNISICIINIFIFIIINVNDIKNIIIFIIINNIKNISICIIKIIIFIIINKFVKKYY